MNGIQTNNYINGFGLSGHSYIDKFALYSE